MYIGSFVCILYGTPPRFRTKKKVLALSYSHHSNFQEEKEISMKNSRVISILCLVALLLSIASTATASSSKNFNTHLSGGNEVPVVVTNAQGQALFKLSKDGTVLHYKLNVANIE